MKDFSFFNTGIYTYTTTTSLYKYMFNEIDLKKYISGENYDDNIFKDFYYTIFSSLNFYNICNNNFVYDYENYIKINNEFIKNKISYNTIDVYFNIIIQ